MIDAMAQTPASTPDGVPESSLPSPNPPAPEPPMPRPREYALLALVLVVAALAFQPALYNRLTHDDVAQLTEWPAPATPAEWLAVPLQPWWPADREKHDWRPLTRLTILAQNALVGRDGPGIDPVASGPMLFAFNIDAHLFVCVLLYAAAVRWGFDQRAAIVGALLFAAHPIHAEAIHQIVGRAETMAAGWMLLGLILWTRWGPFSGHAFWQQPLVFSLALGSKEHAILYPLFLVLATLAAPVGCLPGWSGWHRWRETRQGRRLASLLICLGFVAAGYLTVKHVITAGLVTSTDAISRIENPLAAMPFAERLPAALGVFGYGVCKLFWPPGLAPDYAAVSLPHELGWGWPMAGVGAGALGALLLLAVASAARGGRGWALIVAGVAAWLLTSNLLFPIGVATAPRLWYWPSAAACLGIGWAMVRLIGRLPERSRRLALPLAPAIAAVLLLAVAWRQAPAWRSPRAFAEATLAVFPDSWRGNVNLAREAYQAQDFELGAKCAQRAIDAIPNDAIGWGWLGTNLMFLPNAQGEAEQAFRRALQLDPASRETRNNFANLLRMQGRHAEAETLLQ
jgi:hypothetical protein